MRMGWYARWVFPRLMDRFLGSWEVGAERRRALAPARGETLEIGFGTGLNLPFYPGNVTQLTVLDPEEMLAERVRSRIAAAPFPVSQWRLDAQGRLPFRDGQFDTVVTTFTLCTIPDLRAALAEMRRVLHPKGMLLFLEHGRSDSAAVARWQDRLNPLQNRLGAGCHLNRPIDQFLREAGFLLPKLERTQLARAPAVLGELYRGVAVSGEQ
ncbi:MAG: class I SAM-dependent methyltransferase [Blastocatellia bacterium]